MFATSEKDRFTGIASETILCKKALPRLEKQHPKTNAGGCPRIFGLGGGFRENYPSLTTSTSPTITMQPSAG